MDKKKKNKKTPHNATLNSLPMQWSTCFNKCFCRVVQQQHCYAVQVEAVTMAAVMEFLSCTHHKTESLCFSWSHTPPVWSVSTAAETGGDLLSHTLMSCRRGRWCSHVLASS